MAPSPPSSRPLPLTPLFILLLLYAAPDHRPAGAHASAEAQGGGGGGSGGGGTTQPPPSPAEPMQADAVAVVDVAEVALPNATDHSPMAPAQLVATKGQTSVETAPPPSTFGTSTASAPTAVTATTTTSTTTAAPKETPTPPGTTQGVDTPPPSLPPPTLLPPWSPPHINLPSHHHGGSSRFGPYFEEGADGSNVTARLGSTVRLDCKIGMLQDKTVTWLHRKDDAIHLLTVGRQAYSSDSRFSLAYRYPNNWRLQILFVNRRDEGLYECQVATHPPRIRQVFLRVTAPVLKIVDENHHEVLERYYKAGSEVELTCLASELEEGDGAAEESGAAEQRHQGGAATPAATPAGAEGVAGRVLWRHGDSAISHNTSGRGVGVNVSEDGRSVAVTLTLEAARKGDGGNYTCSVGGLSSATVAIHILNDSSTGELPAAVQHGNSTVPFGVVSMWLQLCCLALSLSVITR
ncbi:uncharacterized protein LOC124165804 [Ischnura elegans]|uniref:uncharacterized protein LOC124165804 n=1 Tax=Ischnura elegans TaxID=197161 RepID=UPI001ED8B635|nr:uncharacterized protein LOC124165804 [Ischnura elegans]